MPHIDPPAEQWELASRFCNRELSPADAERLSDSLRTNGELRAWFVSYMDLHAQLQWEQLAAHKEEPEREAEVAGAESCATGELSTAPPNRSTRSPVLGFLTDALPSAFHALTHISPLMMLLVVVVTAVFWGLLIAALVPRDRLGHEPGAAIANLDGANWQPHAHPLEAAVAVLTGSEKCVWRGARGPRVGDLLAAGDLQLDHGAAEITFETGVKMLVEGPSVFRLVSVSESFLSVGRLVATVPPAGVGFTIETPTARIIDRGTEFGVEMTPAGDATVRVFKGRVDIALNQNIRGIRSDAIQLTAGESRHIHRVGGEVMLVDQGVKEKTFLRALPPQPVTTAADRAGARNRLLADTALLVHYTFDSPDNGAKRLVNRASATAGKYDGDIRGATWTTGSEPDKSALAFSKPDDHVRLNIPGEFAALSLAASLYVEPWDERSNDRMGYASLVATDRWGRPGQFLWQLAQKNQFDLAICTSAREGHVLRIPSGLADDARSQAIPIGNPSFEELCDSKGSAYTLPAGDYSVGLSGAEVIGLRSKITDARGINIAGRYATSDAAAGTYRADNTQNLLNITGATGNNVGYLNAAGGSMSQALAANLQVGTYTFSADLGHPTGSTAGNRVARGNLRLLAAGQEVAVPTSEGTLGVGVLNSVKRIYSVGAGHPALGKPLILEITKTSGEASLYFDNLSLTYAPPAPPVESVDFGRWIKLAVVCDTRARRAMLFVDGTIHFMALPRLEPLVLGPARLGGWLPIDNNTSRNFCGRMDEVVIFGRALSLEEMSSVLQSSSRSREVRK